jgi:DNA-directed RNA polymerase specialized sigma24 family protein
MEDLMKQHAYVSIAIPTNQSFTKQWYNWTHAKVSRHFKRDKERVYDTAQNVRLRLIAKDFIGRWFFKHLTDELVDRSQAERILGGVPITYVGQLQPAEIPNVACQNKACVKRHMYGRGCVRSCANSLWKVSELLDFAKFDHERYYYSPQGHTIESGKVLKLLGYPENQYAVLESMYRQGRLKPSEFTEHHCSEIVKPIKKRGDLCGVGVCPNKHCALGYCHNHYRLSRPKVCLECAHGRDILASRKLSLTHRWSNPEVADAASKLRWNDAQLRPFLREWKRMNMVRTSPLYIMRTDRKLGIDAGLLKYAEMIIDNEVVNDFKRMSRADDMHTMVFNNGLSPELSDGEQVAWESDESTEEGKIRVLADAASVTKFTSVEEKHDLERMVRSCNLTDEEAETIAKVDLGDMSISEFAEEIGKPIQKVHRVRQSALKKLRVGGLGADAFSAMAAKIADRYGCSVASMISPSVTFGPPVIARAEFFSSLFDSGMGITEISAQYGMAEDRVTAAINRACIRESRDGQGDSVAAE